MFWRIVGLWLLLSSVTAAQAAFFSDDEARANIVEIQKQLVQMQGQSKALQTRLDEEQKQQQAVEGRVATVEGQLRSQSLIDLLNQVEQLNADINQLKGQMEVMAHEMETAQQRQRDLYADVDARLRKLETAPPAESAKAPSAPIAVPEQPAVTPPPTAPAEAAVDNEAKDYEAAFALFKAGKYASAAEAFDKFQQTYPESKLAGNAQYWSGTSHFSQHDYKGALAAQQKLLKTYPDHEKIPDAMYSIANCQIQLSEIDSARQTLKTLVGKYPQANIAPKAKERLKQLESLKAKK